MRFLEYQGKELFRSAGIPVPRGMAAATAEEAGKVVEELGKKVMLKVQVPIGGRGKAGGIRPAETPEEAVAVARELLGMQIRGYDVKEVLVEEQLQLEQEFYMGVTIDNRQGKRVFMFCPAGGMEIEEIVVKYPDKLFKVELLPSEVFPEYEARVLLTKAGFSGKLLTQMSSIAAKLVELCVDYDLITCEINPLSVLADGSIIAADAKVEMDSNAVFRHPEFKGKVQEEFEPLEQEAKEIGVTYIKLDGEVGVVSSGAGLGMATMDLLADAGLAPANFLETGGGITKELMANAVKLVAKHEQVKGIVINLYGGVNPLVEAAKGVREAKEALSDLPIVVKALGNQQDEAWRVLEEVSIPLVKSTRTEEAVKLLAELVRGEQG
ncbi:MAG: ADP-forming succinate--CoA ligase subunit beta [bacterium]|jgi:succinyl-CoA synthetase beta subunit